MKSRIASALAVVACVAVLGACSGKGSSGSGGAAPAGGGRTSSAPSSAPAAGAPASTAPTAPAGAVAATSGGDPDGDLTSLDRQLSDVDGALDSAEPTHTADDNG